jgi:hypothetical protein
MGESPHIEFAHLLQATESLGGIPAFLAELQRDFERVKRDFETAS